MPGWRRPCALALLACHAYVAAQAQPGPLPEPLRAEVESLLRGSAVRGAAVVLVDASGPTAALFYGQADVAAGTPMTAATCLRAGSVSKTFTALLAQRLALEGKVGLDAPLPLGLQPAAPAACPGRVTLAQLLEHTAGVVGSSHADYGTQSPDAPVAAVVQQIVQRPLAWCPGAHYAYSNDGITLAAAALEVAGGAGFDALMQEQVFAPLGIASASFATGRTPSCLSRSYEADGSLVTQPWQLPVRPAGALTITAMDLSLLVQMFLRQGAGPQGPVLLPESAARMASGQTGLAARGGATAGAYGLGLFNYVAAGRLVTGHWGRIDGFQTSFGFAPEAGRGMVIMVNTADRGTMSRLRELVAAQLWQGVPAPALPPAVRPAEGMAGWYANASHDMPLRAPWVAMLDVVRIAPDAAGLTLRSLWPWAEPRHVLAVTPTSFREQTLPRASMAFVPQAEGRRWWVDGESYREVPPALAVAKVAVLVLGIVTAVVVLLRIVWLGLLQVAMRGRRRGHATAMSRPALAVDGCLALASAGYLALFGGYAALGLFGGSGALMLLGQPGAASIGLAAVSVLAPTASLLAAVLAARRGGATRWLAALPLCALGLLCLANGWLPLLTWR